MDFYYILCGYPEYEEGDTIITGEKEIIINDDSVIFRYNNNLKEKKIKISYLDIMKIYLRTYKGAYTLVIYTEDDYITVDIDRYNVDEVEKCKLLYSKIISFGNKNYPKKGVYSKYKENSKGEISMLHAEMVCKYDYTRTKIITAIVLILFAIAGFEMFKVYL